MAFNFDFTEITTLTSEVLGEITSWMDICEGLSSSFEDFINEPDFTGQGAEFIKQYVSDTHLMTSKSLYIVLAEYTYRLMLFWEWLFNIDGSYKAKLHEESMTKSITNMENIQTGTEEIYNVARASALKMEEIIDSNILTSVDNYVTSLYDSKENLITKRDEIIEYDHNEATLGLENLKEIVSNLEPIVTRLKDTGVIDISAYQPGNIINWEEYNKLPELLQTSSEYLTANYEFMDKASKHFTKVCKQMQADMEKEMAKERIKQGVITVLTGATGVLMVFATAGTFSLVIGPMVVAYNASNMVEGATDIYFGAIGDPYTAAFNPLQEYCELCGINEDMYHMGGLILTGIYTACAPVSQVHKAVVGGKSYFAQTMIVVETAEEVVEDKFVEYICLECGVDDLTSATLGLYAGVMAMSNRGYDPDFDITVKKNTSVAGSGDFSITTKSLVNFSDNQNLSLKNLDLDVNVHKNLDLDVDVPKNLADGNGTIINNYTTNTIKNITSITSRTCCYGQLVSKK